MFRRDRIMNGGLRIAGIAAAVAVPLMGAVWGYGVLAGDVTHNATAIGKNEADIERLEQLTRNALSNLARDSAVAATKIENIERGIEQLLRKANGQ